MNSTELTMKPLEWYQAIRLELKRHGLTVKQREPFMFAFAQAIHSQLLTNDRPVTREQFESALKLCCADQLALARAGKAMKNFQVAATRKGDCFILSQSHIYWFERGMLECKPIASFTERARSGSTRL